MLPTDRLAWAWTQSLPPAPKAVLGVLAYFANASTLQAYPSAARLASWTGYSRRTVFRALAELRDKKLIHPLGSAPGAYGDGENRPPVKYQLLVPEGWRQEWTTHPEVLS